jgi:hypothetical protein
MYLPNCPLQQVNRTRILGSHDRVIDLNSRNSGANHAGQKELIGQAEGILWLLLIAPGRILMGGQYGRWRRFPQL